MADWTQVRTMEGVLDLRTAYLRPPSGSGMRKGSEPVLVPQCCYLAFAYAAPLANFIYVPFSVCPYAKEALPLSLAANRQLHTQVIT